MGKRERLWFISITEHLNNLRTTSLQAAFCTQSLHISMTWAAIVGFSVTWYSIHPNWWLHLLWAQFMSLITLNTQGHGYLSTPLSPISDPGPAWPRMVKKKEIKYLNLCHHLWVSDQPRTPPDIWLCEIISCLNCSRDYYRIYHLLLKISELMAASHYVPST